LTYINNLSLKNDIVNITPVIGLNVFIKLKKI